MDLKKEQWQQIISIVLGAALAVLAVLGWVITPPPIKVVMDYDPAQADTPVDGAVSFGLTGYEANFNDIYADSVTAAGLTLSGAATMGTDGTSYDFTFYSDTAGDYMLWDESAEALTIIGTNGQDALNVDDGNVDIADDVDIDGTTNLDEVDIDGILNLFVGREHIGAMSIVTNAITYTAAAGGTGVVATVADGEVWIVHAVLVNVTSNFNCTGDDATLVIGDGNDADGFLVLADAELQAADTEGTGFTAGWQGLVPATQGVYVDAAAGSNFFIYAPSGSAETIDYLIDEGSGETLTAGAATIYVIYTRIK